MIYTESDVLVVGAGIQGVGVAQAVVAAGNSVTILERSRPASGTSCRSSKLIHGGLRYLESAQLKLVRESLNERAILLRIAPHLVRLVPFSIPVYRSTSRQAWQIRAGLSLYSLLGGLNKATRFRRIHKSQWDGLDGLRTDGLRRVYQYQDGQTDDAALCRAVLQSAIDLGAECHTETELTAAWKDQDEWVVEAAGPDGERTIRARVVINAAGPWANRVLDRFQPAPPRREIDLVGGTHIELDSAPTERIYYTEAPSDRRAVFTMPWNGHVMVGTTEQSFSGDPAQIRPTEQEVQYLLDVHRHYFPHRGGELLHSWAGLRVLPHGDGDAFDRPREVILTADDERKPSVITVYGGKLTGYRHTAHSVWRRMADNLPARERQADTRTLALPVVPDEPPPR